MRGAVVVGVALLLTGCSGSGGPLRPDPATTSSTSASASSSPSDGGVGASAEPLPSPSQPRSCSDRVLGAKTVHVQGSRGAVHWDLAIPEFSGASSARAVNRHVRASAQDAVDLGLSEAKDDDGARRDVEGEADVTTSDRRTVQVQLTWTDNLAGTAHPTEHVATTVVTTARGAPVRLSDVLVDETSSLRTIGRAVQKQAGEVDEKGLAPKEANFAAWQTTRDGMRFGFGDYQLGGHGLRSYTVPWSTMRPLLSDYGTGLLDPDVDPTTC